MGSFELLRGSPLFSPVPTQTLRALASACECRRVEPGKILVRAGSGQDAVVYLARGKLALYRRNKQRDVTLLLGLLDAPSVFGDADCIVEEPWSVSARAEEESTVVLIPNRLFLQIARAEPDVLWQLYCDSCHRHLMANHTAQALALFDVETRLLRLLLDFARRFGRIDRNKAFLGRPLSGSQLGAALGVNRKTITRTLKKLTDKGSLSRESGTGHFCIHNLSGLEAGLPQHLLGLSSRLGENPCPVFSLRDREDDAS